MLEGDDISSDSVWALLHYGLPVENLGSNDLAFISSLVDDFQNKWLFHVLDEFSVKCDFVVRVQLMREIKFKQNYLVK